MRKIIAAIALTTLLAQPAFAKYYNMAPDRVTTTVHNPPAGAFGKEYIGLDPDGRIQSELRRDPAVDR